MNEKTKVYISIVSHDQEDLIIDNIKKLDLSHERLDIKLILIDNTNSIKLKDFAKEKNHLYFADDKRRGFGENHNKAFEISKAKDDDIFIVCNPDVILDEEQLSGMIEDFIKNKREFGNVRCYYDKGKTDLSNPDRYFPGILNFVISVLLNKRLHYGTNYEVKNPEWISGEFMIIKASIYKKIKGFDEKFFIYVEDIDLCYRINKANIKITHDRNHFIIHETQMASRNVLSQSFKWHLTSVFRYLYKHKIFTLLKIAP